MRRKKNRDGSQNLIIIVLVISLFLLVAGAIAALFAARESYELQKASSVVENIASVETEKEEPIATPPKDTYLTFVAAGDNLIHDNIYAQAAARADNNGYNFDNVYEGIADLIKGTDVAFLNQETIIAEKLFPLSGYPMFNSPEAVGNKMIDLGFNVISVANNHMFDKGESGLLAAMDFWEAKSNTLTIGAWRTEEDMQKPLVIERNGIKIGFVPVAEHTNGLSLPAGTSMRYIRSDEIDLMKEQIAIAKANSDFVVVSIHWGTENSTETNSNQIELSQMFADLGVDLVLGHHSHTVQPMEWRVGANNNKTLVVYSLGNLVSSMLNPQNMLGGILDLELTKDGTTQKVYISSAKMIPVVTQYDGAGRREVRVYKLSDYTEDLAATHGVKGSYDYFSIKYMENIISKNIPEEFRV